MINEQYPKIFFYRRLVQAKLFIDAHYADKIDLGNIADEAYLPNFISSGNSKISTAKLPILLSDSHSRRIPQLSLSEFEFFGFMDYGGLYQSSQLSR